jgi:transposase InsO family protein
VPAHGLHVTPRNPSATYTSMLARQVAAELAEHGWQLERVMTDNGSEFRSASFQAQIAQLGPATAASVLAAHKPTAVWSGSS